MTSYFFAALALAYAAYLIMLSRQWNPQKKSEIGPVRKVCWHCYELHDEEDEWCAACKFALFPDGVTWVWAQQEVDQISERLK